MTKGSCLCGAVTYELTSLRDQLFFCHCHFCQKANGTAFSANAMIPRDNFHLLTDEDNLVAYESSPGKTRYFCATCFNPIWHEKADQPELITLRLGSLDQVDDTNFDNIERKHTNLESQPAWLGD